MQQLNEEKDLYQRSVAMRFYAAGFQGTYEGAPGLGKSRIAYLIMEQLCRSKASAKICVVVPKHPLRIQWEKDYLDDLRRLYPGRVIECIVVNSTIHIPRSYNLVVYDEIHLYLRGKEFAKTFSMLSSPAKLGLSGTILEDDRQYLDALGLPVFDSMGREEGLKRGFLTPTYIYNLKVPLTLSETVRMKEVSKSIAIESGKLPDFYTNCLDPRSDLVVNHAKGTGMKPQEIVGIAMKLQRLIHARGVFLDEHPKKIEAFRRFSERFIRDADSRILTFSKATSVADRLTEIHPDISVSYHSNIPGELWKDDLLFGHIRKSWVKEGRSKKSKNVYENLQGDEIQEELVLKKCRKVSQKACQARILDRFREGEIRILNSAESLKVGIDVPAVKYVFETSRISNRRDFQQKVGRIRGIGIYVCAYMDGSDYQFVSKDEERMIKSQEGLSGIETISDITQI